MFFYLYAESALQGYNVGLIIALEPDVLIIFYFNLIYMPVDKVHLLLLELNFFVIYLS